MKKTLSIAALAFAFSAGSLAAAEPGYVVFSNFQNSQNILFPVYNTDGTARLDGTGFTIEIYAGPAGSTMNNQLTASGNRTHFNTGDFAGLTATTAAVSLPGFDAGSVAALQLRAWDNMSGSVASWEAANVRGESHIFDSPALATQSASADQLAYMTGLGSDINGFSLVNLAAVPEPSTVALGIIGGLALLMRRRRS